MPLTEGLSFRVTGVVPDAAPGENVPANSLTLILSSRQGARVTVSSNEIIDIAPGTVNVVRVSSINDVVGLSGDRPFSVYTYQDLWGNGEQAFHLPSYAWGTSYSPFEWWQDSYSVVGGPVTTATGRMTILSGEHPATVSVRRGTEVSTIELTAYDQRTLDEEVVDGGSRNIDTDPTGMEVTSSSPIAVISGHAKGAVLRFPDGLPGTGDYARPASRSRGNMHDAMLAADYAGTTFVTAPLLYTPTRIRGWKLDEVGIEDDRGDVIRFVALHDATEIRSVSDSVADHVDTVMNAGDTWYAPRVEQATVWTASKPVLCMQYGKSYGRIISQATKPDEDPSVDAGMPLLQTVPSVSQWTDRCLFLAHDETTNFLNVICRREDESRITVNGRPLTSTLRRRQIGNTPYVAFSAMIDFGPYDVQATDESTRFSAWTYGSNDGLQLGKIYGSVAGMNMAIECNDSVIVEQRVGTDTVAFTYRIVDDGGGCADVAYAYVERCDGCSAVVTDSTIVIGRSIPTSIVDGSIFVVSRSGRYVRRWFHLDGTTGVEERDQYELVVSPQPATDVLIIRCAANRPFNAPLQLISLTGEVVRAIATNDEYVLRVDVSDVPAGVYALVGTQMHTVVMIAPR